MAKISRDIQLALNALMQGELVAIPTETVYGLGADATNEKAIRQVFAVKGRPLNHPLILHICPDWDLSLWVKDIPDYAQEMMAAFWPGPLTLVLKAKPSALPAEVNGGQDSIAIRAPRHPMTQALLKAFGRPLVAPSANPFGQISPTTAEHVANSFTDKDFLILDGGRCEQGLESTIVQATDPKGYRILRPGMLDLQSFEHRLSKDSNQAKPRVSGQLDSHYKPLKPLYFFNDWQDVLDYSPGLTGPLYSLSITPPPHKTSEIHHQFANEPIRVAYELYDSLRTADRSAARNIIIELPPNDQAWIPIREKIIKAGQPIERVGRYPI